MLPALPVEAPPAPAPVWRERDFVLLWTGRTVDLFGSQVSWLALPLVAIALLHASAFQVAALGAVGALPGLLFSLPAGVLADRVPRRPLMIAAALGSAVLMGSVPVVAAAGRMTLAQLYGVSFLAGTLGVVYDCAASAMPLLLVGRERLAAANGRMTAARTLAEMAGPSLGGLLVGLLGAARAVAFDAGSFLFSAATAALLRQREPPRAPAPEPTARPRFRAELAAGLRLVTGSPLLRTLAASNTLVAFLLRGVSSVWLLYVVRSLHWSVHTAGLVYGLSLIGGVVGGWTAERVVARLGLSRTLITTALLSAPLELGTPLAGPGPAGPWVVGLLFTASTLAGAVNLTAAGTAVQLTAPTDQLGRVSGAMSFFANALRPLGPLAAGALATAFGLRTALIVLAGATLLWPLLLSLSPLTRPTHEQPRARGPRRAAPSDAP